MKSLNFFPTQYFPQLSQKISFSNSVQTDLEQLGHQLRMTDKIGRMDCILVLPDGHLEGGADPRGDNTAIGY